MLSLILTVCALLSLLPSLFACGRSKGDDGKISIVCTIFPQYDWVRALVGDDERYSVTLLIDNGSDVHSYQPTVADRVEIAECDILVTLGGQSDAWVADMANGSDAQVISLSDISGITLRRVDTEGILSEHIHGEHEHEDHGHAEGSHEGHDHGAYDEHIWLSLRNAAICVNYLAMRISELTPDASAEIERRRDEYISRLHELDAELSALAKGASAHGLLIADRFPFVYLTSDYSIEYCAAFEGCTTESNADFDTVTRLAERANEWKAKYIIVTETSDERLASSVIAASGREDLEVLRLDSMQSVTRARISNGESYISVMRKNLETLRTALS